MPPGRIIVALPEHSIMLIGPKIVVTLEGANVNWEKYFFCWRIELVVAQSARQISPVILTRGVKLVEASMFLQRYI